MMCFDDPTPAVLAERAEVLTGIADELLNLA